MIVGVLTCTKTIKMKLMNYHCCDPHSRLIFILCIQSKWKNMFYLLFGASISKSVLLSREVIFFFVDRIKNQRQKIESFEHLD